jgi:glycosyltransferase involved in cell wall biosynthesis
MPKTSIITTVYNRQRYLASTIESVLSQTDGDFEYVIYDDGSPDDSLSIAQHYAALDNRITVIAAKHQGAAQSLRAAIAASSGDYFGVVDSDDRLASTALDELRQILDATSVGMAYSNYVEMNEHGLINPKLHRRCGLRYNPMRMLVDFVTFHFRLIRRSAYDLTAGVNPDLPAAIDYDLCLKLSEVCDVMHHPHVLYYYRKHSDSISSRDKSRQIQCSAWAVNDALQRRGLADRLELIVGNDNRFQLVTRD